MVARCPESTPEEMKAATAAAARAFPKWKETPVSARARIMFNFQQLIIKHTVRCDTLLQIVILQFHQDELAKSITTEQGKTLEDARGDVFRGLGMCTFAPAFSFNSVLEVVEHSCSVASLAMGETVENVSKNVDTYSYRQPLGVCAGITPFNFPGTILKHMNPSFLSSS